MVPIIALAWSNAQPYALILPSSYLFPESLTTFLEYGSLLSTTFTEGRFSPYLRLSFRLISGPIFLLINWVRLIRLPWFGWFGSSPPTAQSAILWGLHHPSAHRETLEKETDPIFPPAASLMNATRLMSAARWMTWVRLRICTLCYSFIECLTLLLRVWRWQGEDWASRFLWT